MSFIDSAMEVLDRTEASLHSVISDALAAKAYREIATIATIAEKIAAISASRPEEKRMGISSAEMGVGSGLSSAESIRAVEPSWMRPKT